MTEETMNTEICEICEETVFLCTCQRCQDCGTLYDEDTAVTALDDDGFCEDCLEI